ncbi:MAG: hypothetical protein ACI8Z1_001324 [Candidatus Azotimanducaceae bacterium]|jgi:hypothetical protein
MWLVDNIVTAFPLMVKKGLYLDRMAGPNVCGGWARGAENREAGNRAAGKRDAELKF